VHVNDQLGAGAMCHTTSQARNAIEAITFSTSETKQIPQRVCVCGRVCVCVRVGACGCARVHMRNGFDGATLLSNARLSYMHNVLYLPSLISALQSKFGH
jgi:hypothetical protein